MEIAIAYLVMWLLLWAALAWLAERFPAMRPVYRLYVGFWRAMARTVWRWLTKPGTQKRGGGRLVLPRVYYEQPQQREDAP